MNRRSLLKNAVAAIAAAVFNGGSLLSARAAARPPKTHLVEIKGFKFVPDTLSAGVGDTVTWINRDIAPHTATAEDQSWDTGTIGKGESKSLVVSPGLGADYRCRFHPMMKARLEIEIGP